MSIIYVFLIYINLFKLTKFSKLRKFFEVVSFSGSAIPYAKKSISSLVSFILAAAIFSSK